MRVVFFGSGAFGVPTLRMLCSEHEVVGVVSQPDRAAGRGSRLTPTPVSQCAMDLGLEPVLMRPERVNEPEVIERIRGIASDAWIVIAYGQKLSSRLLADRFAINLHASLLPRWRGAAPINAAILAGDCETGNSVITLADRMDAGFVLGQSQRHINPDQTAGELHDLLASDGPALVGRVLDAWQAGTLEKRPQDESKVTHAPKLSKSDGWIDLNATADQVRRRVHGLTPWPGVSATLGDQTFKLLRVKSQEPSGEQAGEAPAGTVLDAARGLVACGGGTVLRIVELQPPGKRAMTWEQFVRGYRFDHGARLRPARERT
ncbi:MAG: methionyl-tRNA formyltransferase [Phycisphaerales bacterium]